MNAIKYLRKAGYDTVSGEFYGKIYEWHSWYEADVRHFHRYRIYNGKNTINCRRLSLGMAKKLCEDIADLLLNERVMITINDGTTSDFVMNVLERNHFEGLAMNIRNAKPIQEPLHTSLIWIISVLTRKGDMCPAVL